MTEREKKLAVNTTNKEGWQDILTKFYQNLKLPHANPCQDHAWTKETPLLPKNM